jgi:hypothetical protein
VGADGVDDAAAPGAPTPARPGPRPTAPAAAPDAVESPAPAGLDGDLDGRIAAVEALPLEDRAAAYLQLHDSLRDHLEGGDVPRSKAE